MHISILSSKRREIPLERLPAVYDPEQQLNVVYVDGCATPAVTQSGYLPTNSKTKADPGDDDPDPAGESLY